MSVSVRDFQEQDYARWLELGEGYLSFYETKLPQEVTDETWRRVLDPGRKDMFGLVAEKDGDVIGFTICVVHPGTWTMNDICYLEDLYVDEAARGQGIGRALIEAVYAKAQELNHHRVYWRTKADNKAARDLYEKVAIDNNWVMYEHHL
ncbi:GNAT family N-acetyltransferase [Magnetovibrio sp. PR-2]|uniref:GNAT family N-acetyltransferase n=1 Tax=Magnetovibrio sp. PR-2 TaxID=3120356 RepID=UPI002FCDFA38